MGRPWIGIPTGYDAEKQRLGLDRYSPMRSSGRVEFLS